MGIPSQEQVIKWFDELSNWGRWGPDDMLGTLNLITQEKRIQAASLIREGITVSCALTISYEPTVETPKVPKHFMIRTGESSPVPNSRGRTNLGDHFAFDVHGAAMTHLDAPAHSIWRSDDTRPRTLYNGFPDSLVNIQGANMGSIELAGGGIVTRGILLDLPGLFEVEYLEPGSTILPEQLEAAEDRQSVRVTAGDALLINTGYANLRSQTQLAQLTNMRTGLGAACLPWLRSRDVALLTSDTTIDVQPMQYPELGYPIHGVGMVGLGLWLMDKMDPEELISVCRQLNRWEFMFIVAPLKWSKGTGSPVNPLALL